MKTAKIIRRSYLSDNRSLDHLHPTLRRIFLARGIQAADELEFDLVRLHHYDKLLGMEQAATLLAEAVQQQKKILVIGDYDVDGATATTVAVLALRAMGSQHTDFMVPNRFEYGYGLTPELVEAAMPRQPDLIITVDNGTSQFAGVARAKALGLQVVITDHHLAGDTLPDADAIVNPNLDSDPFPSKHLAGVGVIFYVMLALRAKLNQSGWFEQNAIQVPNMMQFLDVVALGTIADVVKLDQNNRILVHHGLNRIRAGLCRPGITALLRLAKRDPKVLAAMDLSFVIAPRLNAAGRIDDMSLGVRCLLTDDNNEAQQLAQRLDDLNAERITIEREMHAQALDHVQEVQCQSQSAYGICLYDPRWHQGIIGIIASRLKEQHNQPVIIFAKQNEHELKGSARSIPELHIRDLLANIALHHPELIIKFGGHAMAAGLSIPMEAFETFTQIYRKMLLEYFQAKFPDLYTETDGELSPQDLTLPFATLLHQSGPWGAGFPEPSFDGEFTILEQRLVGQKHLKLSLTTDELRHPIPAIAFNIDSTLWPNPRIRRVHIAYQLAINHFQGMQSIQLVVSQLDPLAH